MNIIDIIDKSREQVFVCIGTMRTPLDSIAPRAGTLLKNDGYNVIGTSDSPVHANNIHDILPDIISIDTSKYQVIAIDAMLGTKEMPLLIIEGRPCRPGYGIGSELPEIGECTIGANLGYVDWYDDIIASMMESYDGVHKSVDVEFANITAFRIYNEINKAYKKLEAS